MLLSGGGLRVIHVTTHVSMENACKLITKERVLDVIRLAQLGMRLLGHKEPRIAVAGFNAHCSENGLFGDQEARAIEPAVKAAQAEGIRVEGPIPPDTVFCKAVGGLYDIVVAQYHDQGHIPLKLLGFRLDVKTNRYTSMSGINCTIGLPIIRTSVDHGTAYGKAGEGRQTRKACSTRSGRRSPWPRISRIKKITDVIEETTLRVFVIADDFTGALDTATQFSKIGLKTAVYSWNGEEEERFEDFVQVAVFNLESRHLAADAAYRKVRGLVEKAAAMGIDILYKKTDSALRGNIGGELQAVLDGSGGSCLYFLPAYPRSGRTTQDGIHYFRGVPIAETLFGKDPFEPVKHSRVADIISEQSPVRTAAVRRGGPLPRHSGEPCVYICDCLTDQDIRDVCRQLPDADGGRPLLLAGCAGLPSTSRGTWSARSASRRPYK
jgi:hypothetical protein